MFVQQKNLPYLNMPGKRLRRLFSSTVNEQVALPGYPAQMATAYLAALAAKGGIQVILGFFLTESRSSVFFLPQNGEVPAEKAEKMVQEGLEFAESMGFVLADADIHKLPQDKLEAYWTALPICKPPAPKPIDKQPEAKVTGEKPQPHPKAATEQPQAKTVEKKPEPKAEVAKPQAKTVEKKQPPQATDEKPRTGTANSAPTQEKKVTTGQSTPPVEEAPPKPRYSLDERRSRCKESLGRFLASF